MEDIYKEEVRKSTIELYQEIDECIIKLLKARRSTDQKKEQEQFFQMERLLCNTMQHLTCVLDLLESNENKQRSPEENVVIPVWKFERIHEAIRLSINYRRDLRDSKYLPETCLDRVLNDAWSFSYEVVAESQRESRNAKIRNKLSPFSNVIKIIEDLSCNPNTEYRDLLINSIIKYKDDLRYSLEELKKLI